MWNEWGEDICDGMGRRTKHGALMVYGVRREVCDEREDGEIGMGLVYAGLGCARRGGVERCGVEYV